MQYGPQLKISQNIHQTKYRQSGESFTQSMERIASALSDNSLHQRALLEILLQQRFLPAGRIQSGAGTDKSTTLYNCFVMPEPLDDFVGPGGIMDVMTKAAQTMRMGGGVGYNFSELRPRGYPIKTLDSQASGPVSFMNVYSELCHTISSAGHRRGAQMALLDIEHPDIFEYVDAKTNTNKLTGFNISVGVTDKFLKAVKQDDSFDLSFKGKIDRTIKARDLWHRIMKNTWNWAEPGVVNLDRINEMNNLWYCETLRSVNPCQEQPLPAWGACLLGSFNLVQYIRKDPESNTTWGFDWTLFIQDIFVVTRAMDNVIDKSKYPLDKQQEEAYNKRRMGLGITAYANASEILGWSYGSTKALKFLSSITKTLRDFSYRASVELAKEKGSFPLLDKEKYLDGKFIKTLPEYVRESIWEHGIRNSHLTSIAPTGTISIAADNVSSGIEPVFNLGYQRTIQTFEGPTKEFFSDYAYRNYGVIGKVAQDCTVDEHLNTLITAQQFVDSSISKTVNVGSDVTFPQFEDIYMKAFDNGCKGLSTFRLNGERQGILEIVPEVEPEVCTIDENGQRSCSL